MFEGARDDLHHVALVIDAGDPADEIGLVVRLDQHRGVRGQVDRLAGGDLELDLADLGRFAIRVGELAPAGRASFVGVGPPERTAGPAAPELTRAVEPGALGLCPLLLGPLQAVDQLQGRVELLRPRRMLRRDAPVEQAEGIADHAVRLGHDRLAGGDGEELRTLRLTAGRTDGQDPETQVITRAVRSGLRDALQHEIGEIETQLDRILVAE